MAPGHHPALAFMTLWAVLIATAGVGNAHAQSPSLPLTSATQQGTFNVGPAHAEIRRVSDPAVVGEVLRLDYNMPRGTAAGVWSKAFPGGMDAKNIDVVRLAVKGTGSGQSRQIATALEIKGTAGIQRIPMEIHPDWTFVEEPVRWPTIGNLMEVVVTANPVGDVDPASGTIDIAVRFERLPWLRKLAENVAARIVGVALLGGALALLTALLGTAVGRRTPVVGTREREPTPEGAPTAGRHPLTRDLVRGAGSVFIVGLALAVFELGDRGAMEAGWAALLLASAGVLVAEWWKFGLTGRHLSAAEVFRDFVANGVLAASSSGLAILQAPADWSELLLLSRTVAASAVVVYHASNAMRLATTGRHLGAAGAILIVGAPFAVGDLTLLTSDGLLQRLGNLLSAGALSAWPSVSAFVARVFVLFVFNEAVSAALGAAATRWTRLRTVPAHLSLLAVSAAAAAGPWIASIGSGAWAAAPTDLVRLVVAVLTTAFSQAGLWAEVYLVTGLVLDAIHGAAPSRESVAWHPVQGLKKGMVYSGTFMAILYGLGALADIPAVQSAARDAPTVLGILSGALAFPLLKTVIETFDGSHAFFRRVAMSYRNPTLYLRGAVVGGGLGYGLGAALDERAMLDRVVFGFGVGVAAFAGVNLLRDGFSSWRDGGRPPSWRVDLVHGLLGGFIGAAVGFYLDAVQVDVVVAKFHRYLAAGMSPEPFGEYPLLSKWGFINLGTYSGGVSLLFDEALAGVISWSIPAWLFALNRTFMSAYFRREAGPIRSLFTRDGLTGLSENMIQVFRWGLWMSPIIKSFLRPMGTPTWYNQDGAIRTLWAIVQDLRLSPEAFHAWSLDVFVALLAYDSVRILIWLDHMGLRVATLVNLSFLGMDRLDARLSRFLGPAATARCIPEAVKRFTTWAPLLIPFYIPRGKDWDYAWGRSQAIQAQDHGGILATIVALPLSNQLLLMAFACVVSTAVFATFRLLGGRSGSRTASAWSLGNAEYEVTLKANGEVFSQARRRGYDVSRRSYDLIDPAGRTLFLVDPGRDAVDPGRARPLIGNFPAGRAGLSTPARGEHALTIVDDHDGLRTTLAITLPGPADPAELWTIAVENRSERSRTIKVVPYLEWVLNRPDADRGHTQYNRLFAEIEYVRGLHAVLAWDKHAKALGVLASDVAPEGFLSSRIDFIGRARSVWTPRVLETLAFSEAADTDAHPTLDPIASLLLGLTLAPRGEARVRLLIGMTRDKAEAIDLIARHLEIPGARAVPATRLRKTFHPIGHGEVPTGTPQPYSEFSDDGRTLRVHTPFTTRPYDHTLSNALGQIVTVTNRGLHTSSSVNAQQNRLTPDAPDTATREVPGEAFYLYDPDRREWFSPTYHPLNDPDAAYDVEFGVDGTATFRMSRDSIETELTVFVPPDDPAGVYVLTVRNRSAVARRLRLSPYFQMVLAGQPEQAGPLKIRHDPDRNALFFENPRNSFRDGPAFVALSCPVDRVETRRGRFFGAGRDVAHPSLLERGEPDVAANDDDRPVAAFLATLEVPAHGERQVVVVLGQADRRGRAEEVIRKYRDLDATTASLEATRRWWLDLLSTVHVQTGNPDFDHYLYWLRYQALAERIWARRGFYQASGAYGFRDQLQDSVNLIWMDPILARRQILLHASQQFLEGDVVHWFHCLQDGRTGFVGRTHASDNLLWLAWAVVEYVGATGDETLLDERTTYLESEQPFPPLPEGKHGMGFDPLRSARDDSVYRHGLRSIDLVLERRMGAHGLPLIGTGDWNDGLDEIGSQGRGESIWLGFFLYYILERMVPIVARRDGPERREYYDEQLGRLKDALEWTWRDDRYLRAIHDDGTEIGVQGSGVWEIDALTAAWAVMSGINPGRGRIVFDTAVRILEKETTILLGWPPLREDTKPYLGRSSGYPEGVRENGMYCHGVQWLVGAARLLADDCERSGEPDEARGYRETAYRLWLKTSPIPHVAPAEIETYGGQPNKQAADMVTTFDPGRMIWHGYTGAAGWMFRQALEGVLGLRLVDGAIVPPAETSTNGGLNLIRVSRDLTASPLPGPTQLRPPAQQVAAEETTHPT